jgi:hypothetical protein
MRSYEIEGEEVKKELARFPVGCLAVDKMRSVTRMKRPFGV